MRVWRPRFRQSWRFCN